jgi:hypothetical protein
LASNDQERIREIQERLARMQQENAEAALTPSEAAPPPASPVTPARRPGRRRGWLFLVSLAVIAFVFGELAITAQGYTGPDFDEARRVGQATVLSCERRGPIGWGFGFWDECTADVRWDGGFFERRTFDQRNYLHADEVGKTVTVGENSGLRGGGTSYSRHELPSRPWVVAIGVVLVVIAAVPAIFLLFALIFAIRDGLRRLMRR